MRWREAAEPPDAELLGRLALEARTQAREILAARGFVSPEVSARVFTDEQPMRVVLSVEPGKAVRVAAVDVQFRGPIVDSADPLDAQALAEVREQFALAPGTRFTQTKWLEAKQRALDRIARRRWPAATIAASEVRIDPETARAEVSLTIESGPAFQFGGVTVEGLARYDARLASLGAPVLW